MTRVLVCGSRSWTDRERVFATLDQLHDLIGISLVIEGCEPGAPALVEQWAAERHIPNQHFPANRAKWGKAAGYRRNGLMLVDGEPEMVVAFHDTLPRSAGGETSDMVHKAEKWGLTVVVVTHPQPEEIAS